MWRISYNCFFILLTAFVMWVVYRRRLRAMRIRFNKKLAQRTRIAREPLDTMLQTIQGSRFLVEVALEKYDDIAQLRTVLVKLSSWLGHATQEGQEALNLLSSSDVEKNDD